LLVPLGLGGIIGCHHYLAVDPVLYPAVPQIQCPAAKPPVSPGATANPVPAAEPQPLDLPTALRLADAQNPEIALARERIREALAVQDRAEFLWLPTFEIGPTWQRHDGQIQRVEGPVITVSRSSLFVGGGPTLSLDLGEAYFAPLAARQLTAARAAGAAAVTNNRLLDVALAYLDLLQVQAALQINTETTAHAQLLFNLTKSYENTGKGAAADTARARTELYFRERERFELLGQAEVSTARLVQLLQLPPGTKLRPAEPAIVPIQLISAQMPLPELIAQALLNRPELTENRAVIAATLERWRAAKVAPLVPKVRLAYSGGGFGGGPNERFSDFDWRGDASLTAVWELRNMGFGDLAQVQERHSQYAQAAFRQHALEAEVAAQVVSAQGLAHARQQELEPAQRAVQAARESYRLNEERIRRAPEQGRPIELLQALQALARARQDYLQVVADYNRAQFRLYAALGNPPPCALEVATSVPTTEPVLPPPSER
jgi:outer membrane protein TolC